MFDCISLVSSVRKRGGVKAHVLYGIEAQVPTFYTVTTVSKYDSAAMSAINYEPNQMHIIYSAERMTRLWNFVGFTLQVLCSQIEVKSKVQIL